MSTHRARCESRRCKSRRLVGDNRYLARKTFAAEQKLNTTVTGCMFTQFRGMWGILGNYELTQFRVILTQGHAFPGHFHGWVTLGPVSENRDPEC